MKLRSVSRGFHSVELIFTLVVISFVVVGATIIQKRHTKSTFAEVDTIPTIASSEYQDLTSTQTAKTYLVDISKNKGAFAITKVSETTTYTSSAHTKSASHKLQTLDASKHVLDSVDINLLGVLLSTPPKYGEAEPKVNPVDTFNTQISIPYSSEARWVRIVSMKDALLAEKYLDDTSDIHTETKFRALSTSGSMLGKNGSGNTAKHKETIAIIGGGYTAGSNQFLSDVNAISTELFNYEPFKTRRSQIDIVYADNNTVELGCARWAAPYDRIITCDQAKVRQALVARGIPFDTVLVVWNAPQAGGASYIYDHMSFITNAGMFTKSAVHELGHSLAQLNDEYSYGGNSTQDNAIWANCYRGNPPTKAWDIPLSSYAGDCTYNNYYASSPTSIMRSLMPSYFNYVSMMIINAELDRVAGTFTNDSAPAVTITNLSPNQVYSDSLTPVVINYSDDDAVVRATLLVNGVPITDSYDPPFTFWMPNAGMNGNKNIAVKVYDSLGKSTTSSSVPITIDTNARFSISVLTPAPDVAIDNEYVVMSNITNTTRNVISKVELLVDDKVVSSSSDAPYYPIQFDTTRFGNGKHTIMTNAVFTNGNSFNSNRVTVTFNNIIALTPDTQGPLQPALKSAASAKSSITINWDRARDRPLDNTATGVKEYRLYRANGTILVGTVRAVTGQQSYSFTEAGLSSDTTYGYSLIAIDYSNNASARSAILNAKTKQ